MNVLVSTGTFSQSAIPKIDKFLTDEFPGDQPGAVVLIAKGDSIVYKKSFGLANVESGVLLRSDMIFQVASITKQFTAAAIMQLSSEKKLSTSDPVQKYLDKFPDKGKTITIGHLLSQTSGIPEFFDVGENDAHLLVKEHTPWELISYFKDRPLDFEPGSRFAYSNSNYVLLGAIIEKVSGVPYAEHMDTQFFVPWKMSNTSVWYKDSFPPDQRANGYSLKDGKYQPSLPLVGSVVYSSGGIVSTVGDLMTWNSSWVKTHLEFFQEEGYHYGLNVRRLQGSPTIQHGGNLFGFTTNELYLPEEDIYVCILSNAAVRGTEDIANYIASEMIGKPIDAPVKAPATATGLEAFAGTYKLKGNTRIMEIVIVANRLVLTFPDQPGGGADVQPTGNDMFESKKVKAKLTFLRDANGKVTRVDVKQGKGSYSWIKEE